MAGVIRSVAPDAWDTTFDLIDTLPLLKLAVDGNRRYAQRVNKDPDFIVEAFQDVSAEATTLIDLTARGVTFPAGTIRIVEFEYFITGDTAATETGYVHQRNAIVGGTTPVLGVVVGAIDTNLAGGAAVFTGADPIVAFTMASNNVTIVGTNEGATESNATILKVYVGRLQTVRLGV
jgi:hypothetical protein